MHSAVQYRFFGKGLLNNVILWVQGLYRFNNFTISQEMVYSTAGKSLYDNCFDCTIVQNNFYQVQLINNILFEKKRDRHTYVLWSAG